MKKCLQILLLCLSLIYCVGISAQDPKPTWINSVVDEIINETDLCERCTWLKPTFTRVEFGNNVYYFLRYSCTIKDGLSRMYDVEGNIVGECVTTDGDSECGFSFNAMTVYTFAEDIQLLWRCDTGFQCDFAKENGAQLYVPISIDESRCSEGVKILGVSEEYESYQWSGEGITSSESFVEIDQPGNYQVIVVDEFGCQNNGTILIENISELSVVIKGPKRICQSGNAELLTNDYLDYKWSTGSTDKQIKISAPGNFEVTVTNSENCKGTAVFMVEPYQDLDLDIASTDLKVIEGRKVDVNIDYAGDEEVTLVSIEWEGDGDWGCSDCFITDYKPSASGEVRANVLDSRGCINEEQVFIEVVSLPLEIYVPNIFAPDLKGVNSKFTVYTDTNVNEIAQLTVYNRWGNVVFDKSNFQPNDQSLGWDGLVDGVLLAQGIYVFRANVSFSNGSQKVFTGEVLLAE